MTILKSEIVSLKDVLMGWAEILLSGLNNQHNTIEDHEEFAKKFWENEIYQMRLGFVSFMFLKSFGQINELLSCYKNFSPEQADWVEFIHNEVRFSKIFGKYWNLDEIEIEQKLFWLAKCFFEQENNEKDSEINSDPLELVLRKFRAFRESSLFLLSNSIEREKLLLAGTTDSDVNNYYDSLDNTGKKIIRKVLKNYYTNSCVFPWIVYYNYKGEVPIKAEMVYSPIFNIINSTVCKKGDRDMKTRFDIVEKNLEIPETTKKIVQKIFDRIILTINQTGYDGFCKILTEECSSLGQGSFVDSDEIVTIIPGDGQGMCTKIVLVLAKGRDKNSKYEFESVAQQMKAYLAKCPNTEVVIFMTDLWDMSLLEQHFDRIPCYILPILVNERQVIPMEWPSE